MSVATALKPFHGFNHNNTLLGSYGSEREAKRDTNEYMMQTGNAGIVVELANLDDDQRKQAEDHANR